MPGNNKKNTDKIALKKETVADASSFFQIPSWAPLIVALFTAIIYSKGLHNEFTIYDDNYYVTENPLLRDFSIYRIKDIFTSFCYFLYLPFTILVYFFEYHLFGLDSFPYHLFQLAIHLINLWVVFLLAEKLSGYRLTALIVCILFAVHPMHVESVAWISELKDVLYTLFYLSSLLFYLYYIDNGFKRKHYIIALFLFLLSLLSKPAAITLPVLLIAIDMYRGRKMGLQLFPDKILFFLISIVFGIVMIAAVKSSGGINDSIVGYGFINKIFLTSYAFQSYIVRAVIPYNLSAMYHYPPLKNGLLPWYYYPSLFSLVVVAWLLIRRSSFKKELLFGFFFFLITISIMLQVFSAGSAIMADRYTYVSYIGLFYIAGQWISMEGVIKWRRVIVVAGSLLVLVYSVQSWLRLGVWKDSMTLFSDIIAKDPGVYFGYYMRGNAEKKDGDYRAAIEDYNTAIILSPNLDDGFYNRGIVYDAMGEYKLAINDYSNSIRLNPRLPDAYNNRGWDLFQIGDTLAALQNFDTAIKLKPEYSDAYNNRGWVFFSSGAMEQAIDNFTKAITTNRSFVKAYHNRAAAKAITNDNSGAIADYNIIINELKVDDAKAYFFRGITRMRINDAAGGCADLQAALQRGYPEAAAAIKDICH